MLKKIIILIVLIILGGISYEYIPNLFSNNDQIIYIDGDKDQYKFSPTDKEGKNFNGESLKIYDITKFLKRHPGGSAPLRYAGIDTTKVFHKIHSPTVLQKMGNKFQVGLLKFALSNEPH